ncbi:MAG: hypothetical protein JWO32_1644 [Bacteroidetes bacterium]|nr:hypothetical protein [Bacteroidota bacterium]
MRIILILLFSGVCFVCLSQKRKADLYITKLNDGQFTIDHSKKASFSMNSPEAFRLIKTGKSVTPKLIAALNDSSKTIMAHLVLCHIYFKHVSFAGPKVLVTNEGDLNKYFLGQEKAEGLTISETNINGKYTMFVLPSDRTSIIEYWKKRAKNTS